MSEPLTEVKCLDHGFIRLVDHMGSDQRIVDAARVSYQQGTKVVQTDRHLIRYLVRNHHTTPLEKVVLEFHVKCPMAIGEQWLRHRTGSFNKISGRYSVMKDEFFIPEVRKQSAVNRQGSSDELLDNTTSELITKQCEQAYSTYESLLAAGAARELARFVLPANLYTEFYWTVNLWNLFHFLTLRLDKLAQVEIRVFAEGILSILKSIPTLAFVVEAFKDYILDAPNLTKYEFGIVKDLISQLTAKGAPPSYQLEDLKNKVTKLLEDQQVMSKREKEETRLMKLLFEDLE